MKSWLAVALGVVAVLIGAVWTLQGLGQLGGSAMTGEPLWAVVGPIVAVAGLVLAVVGLRARRRAATPPSNEAPPS